jgi:hypothetical protein
MSNDLLTETLQCLEKTYTCSDKEIRTAAEKRLKELQENLIVHINTMLDAIRETNYLNCNIFLIFFS